MAPSGKFWIAIPMESAKAPISVMPLFPESTPAKTTPTAIPSGMLWRVTANTNMVVRLIFTLGPSVSLLLTCKWGIVSSNSNRNRIPNQKPIKAGKKANFPIFSDCSIDGIIRLHIDAATITPAAKPVNIFWIFIFKSFFINNTQAAPKDVPKKGINIPWMIFKSIFFSSYKLLISYTKIHLY